MNLKRGLVAPAQMPVLKFKSVLKNLPAPSSSFGHYQLITDPWGMLMNDRKSDCVVAGAAHETMLLGAMGGHKITFDDPHVYADYLAMQGNPIWPFNDRGLDMVKAADWRRKRGIHDCNGIRHRIDAYADLELGTAGMIRMQQAAELLGVAGVGLNLPGNAEQLWAEHQPWTDTHSPPSGEGHYVACVGKNSAGNLMLVTWGRLQAASPEFVARYGICFLAYLSREQLNNAGLTPDQYDVSVLNGFLNELA